MGKELGVSSLFGGLSFGIKNGEPGYYENGEFHKFVTTFDPDKLLYAFHQHATEDDIETEVCASTNSYPGVSVAETNPTQGGCFQSYHEGHEHISSCKQTVRANPNCNDNLSTWYSWGSTCYHGHGITAYCCTYCGASIIRWSCSCGDRRWDDHRTTTKIICGKEESATCYEPTCGYVNGQFLYCKVDQ